MSRLINALAQGFVVMVRDGGLYQRLYDVGTHPHEPGPVGYVDGAAGEYWPLDPLPVQNVLVCGPHLKNWFDTYPKVPVNKDWTDP